MTNQPETEQSKIPTLVVWFLGVTAVILSSGVLLLTYYDKKIDGGLFTMAGGAIAALGALLSNTRPQSNSAKGTPDDPVTVETAPGAPVETTRASDASAAAAMPETVNAGASNSNPVEIDGIRNAAQTIAADKAEPGSGL